MSIRIFRLADLPREERASLQSGLDEYYLAPPRSYYLISDEAADLYTAEFQPFHCDLVDRVRSGTTLLELGCGTAHLCPHVQKAGGLYTGVDYSADLLQRNRERFPGATFMKVGEELAEAPFDIVASLYTIEHIIDPSAYLESMWKLCKPNGLLAVICPDFIETVAFPPCLFFGSTPRRFREKVRSFHLLDACLHLIDLKWTAPRWKARARRASPGAFWINTRPAELFGAAHGVDTDAVHLPRLNDLVYWFERRGAEIVTTSRMMPGIPPAVLEFNCYALARKKRNGNDPP